jgi:hypothetical protein
LNRMAAACGLLATLHAAQAFISACPPESRRMNDAYERINGVRY